MKKLNLSEWALEHPQMVVFLMVILMLSGTISYFKLGRAEDPSFTFRVMVVRTLWNGASAEQVEHELTDRIEKKLQETPNVDLLHSASKPGESLVFILLKESTRKPDVVDAWYQVRKKIEDIRYTLPAGVLGPFINDEFGDVDVMVLALTGDGFDLAELRRQNDRMAKEMLRVPDVKKVELIGVQDEKIYIEIAPARLAALGISPLQIADALQKQNALLAGGLVETDTNRIRMRVSGPFDALEQVRNADLVVAGHHLRLGDVAEVKRGFADPPSPRMRYNGMPAVGLGIVMANGGDVIALGKSVKDAVRRFQSTLPAGIDVNVVADQPEVVKSSIELFIESLGEAILIVLIVSFISLGWRTGTVVALSIPLVLAITFMVMKVFDIDLQRISLGALVIALGLLVDDAIIAAEMMVVKMEQGWDRFRATTFAYTSTAFPMLTGTLITAAGFTPVGFARSQAGEYTISIFQVTTIALIASWLVAVIFTPYIGYRLLNPEKLMENAKRHGDDIYNTPFYRRLRALVEACLRQRWKVIGATVLIFAASMVLFGKAVEQQFFPASNRPDLLINLWLPQGASLKATEAEVEKVEKLLAGDKAILHYSAYVGNGAPRFYLPLDQQLFNDNFAEFVVAVDGFEATEPLRHRLEAAFNNPDGAFSSIRARVLRLENGPPVGFPVQFRVTGDDPTVLRRTAEEVATVMRANPHLRDVSLDWNEKIKSVRVEIDQDRARALGISSQDVSLMLQGWLTGATITQFREHDQLIDVVWRAPGIDRGSLDRLPDLNIPAANNRYVPLAQVAKLVPVLEEGLIWRRNRVPTISVRGDMADGVQAPSVSEQINPQLDAIRAKLPSGYRIEMGGVIEEAAKGENPIGAVMPIMLLGVLTMLMMQLQSIGRTVLVLLTAPLGMIGVALALWLFRAPFGFVALLGVIALAGMIMRNSVILVDQIEQDRVSGKSEWESIISSTVRRFRPIVLTALAAILAMVPLTRQLFWGPMAIAIMGGLTVATVFTCFFLPALYAAWFRVKENA